MNTQTVQFTKRARGALTFAEAEAQRLNHNYIGTEHLLLGLIGEEQGVAAEVLQDLNFDLSALKEQVEAAVGRGSRKVHGQPQLAPRAKEVIDLATYIAEQIGHIYTGSEHLIIAIMEEGNGLAAHILQKQVTRDQMVGKVVEFIIQKSSVSATTPEHQYAKESLARVRQTLATIGQAQKWSLSSTTTDIFKLRRKRMVDQITLAAAQEERNRLARDLHDSIKQQLFSINASAAAIQAHWQSDPAGTQRAIEDVQQSARAAMVEMDAMLQQLSPTPLLNVGLIDAIRQQGEALEYRTGAKVSTALVPLPTSAQLSLGMQEMLFRITQEALSNIARHARASNVQIRLALADAEGILVLEVRDDGQGFQHVEATQGMGLTNLATRAERLGGQLDIRSQIGEGTTVRVEIPLLPVENKAIVE